MKIQILSDLHHEFGIFDFPVSNCDVLILAGDVNLGVKGIQWIKAHIKNKSVIYVLGNHEYYKGSYPKTLHKIRQEAQESNVHVLENESVELEGVRFHGATLWTDFSLFGNPVAFGNICQGKMNDYKRIRRDPSYSKLRSVDTFNIHQASRRWLTESLSESNSGRNIVVTHHAPSAKSLPKEFREDPVSTAYASDLEELIERFQPDYWIHGHIHTPVTYEIGKARIICNPQGYADEPYNGYEKELVVDI
jgi:Icc-related predicted phosphoesterase